MALTLQRTANGNLLRLTNGNMQGSCCCGGGTTPSTCPNSDPEVLVTITGNGPGGTNETITWCGETWTPAQSGQTRTICPNFYSLAYPQTSSFYEAWSIGGSNGPFGQAGSLQLVRGRPGIFTNRNRVVVRDSDAAPTIYASDNRTSLGFSNLDMGVLTTGSPFATANSYRILDTFFGSYTAANGITYTWARGNGW